MCVQRTRASCMHMCVHDSILFRGSHSLLSLARRRGAAPYHRASRTSDSSDASFTTPWRP